MGGTQSSGFARLLHVVDGDHSVRAKISNAVTGNGGHAEIYEDLAELIATGPTGGAILLRTPADGVAGLAALLHAGEIFLPIILFAENPSPSDIVRAVHAGAADYLAWPFSPEDLMASCDYAIGMAQGANHDMLRRQKARNVVERLSPRERQVLGLMLDGHSNKNMGLTLQLSPRTVEDYRLKCLQKMGVASSSAAIRIGLEAGLSTTGEFAGS